MMQPITTAAFNRLDFSKEEVWLGFCRLVEQTLNQVSRDMAKLWEETPEAVPAFEGRETYPPRNDFYQIAEGEMKFPRETIFRIALYRQNTTLQRERDAHLKPVNDEYSIGGGLVIVAQEDRWHADSPEQAVAHSKERLRLVFAGQLLNFMAAKLIDDASMPLVTEEERYWGKPQHPLRRKEKMEVRVGDHTYTLRENEWDAFQKWWYSKQPQFR